MTRTPSDDRRNHPALDTESLVVLDSPDDMPFEGDFEEKKAMSTMPKPEATSVTVDNPDDFE